MHGAEASDICRVVAVCVDSISDTEESDAISIVGFMPKCSNHFDAASRDHWLHRIASYIDKKLGEAKLSWFEETTAADEQGTMQEVFMGKHTDKISDDAWIPVKDSLLSMRRSYDAFPRLCLPGEVPTSRNENPFANPCHDQTVNGNHFKSQTPDRLPNRWNSPQP